MLEVFRGWFELDGDLIRGGDKVTSVYDQERGLDPKGMAQLGTGDVDRELYEHGRRVRSWMLGAAALVALRI